MRSTPAASRGVPGLRRIAREREYAAYGRYDEAADLEDALRRRRGQATAAGKGASRRLKKALSQRTRSSSVGSRRSNGSTSRGNRGTCDSHLAVRPAEAMSLPGSTRPLWIVAPSGSAQSTSSSARASGSPSPGRTAAKSTLPRGAPRAGASRERRTAPGAEHRDRRARASRDAFGSGPSSASRPARALRPRRADPAREVRARCR